MPLGYRFVNLWWYDVNLSGSADWAPDVCVCKQVRI